MSHPLPSYDGLMQPTRRHFLGASALGLGALAMRGIMGDAHAAPLPKGMHFPAKAKRVIYLFQAGGPSQLETLDPKPLLRERHMQPLPDSVRQGQRLTGMSGYQATLPLAGSFTNFKKYGKSGIEYSDLLTHTGEMADDLCVIRSMHTEAINHDPAITFFCSGNQVAGRPSMGAWASYGLGSMNENLPAFIVMVSQDASKDQPLYSRLWGAGFLPSEHQGVQFKAGKEPVLYLTNPEGVSPHARRGMLDTLGKLNADQRATELDPEVDARLAQAEMAYRMQIEVPEVMNINDEPAHIHELYGTQPGEESFANNCLLARKLVEKGVRVVQLYDWGWDTHGTDHDGSIDMGLRNKCRTIDRPMTALLLDLKQRGLLEETLVVWGGEFGRTPMQENREGKKMGFLGRDHHVDAFTMWMAGGGVKKGQSYGITDDFGFAGLEERTSVHDLHATILHLMGFDHEKFTHEFQGRPFRLTDVHGELITKIIA